jgi:hypothetical protein
MTIVKSSQIVKYCEGWLFVFTIVTIFTNSNFPFTFNFSHSVLFLCRLVVSSVTL